MTTTNCREMARRKTEVNIRHDQFDAALRSICEKNEKNTNPVDAFKSCLVNYITLRADLFAQILTLNWEMLSQRRMANVICRVIDRHHDYMRKDSTNITPMESCLVTHVQIDTILCLFETAVDEWILREKPSTMTMLFDCKVCGHEHTPLCTLRMIYPSKDLAVTLESVKDGRELFMMYIVKQYKEIRLCHNENPKKLTHNTFLGPILTNGEPSSKIISFISALTSKICQTREETRMLTKREVDKLCRDQGVNQNVLYEKKCNVVELFNNSHLGMIVVEKNDQMDQDDIFTYELGMASKNVRVMTVTKAMNKNSEGDDDTLFIEACKFFIEIRKIPEWDDPKSMWCRFQLKKRDSAKFYFNIINMHHFKTESLLNVPSNSRISVEEQGRKEQLCLRQILLAAFALKFDESASLPNKWFRETVSNSSSHNHTNVEQQRLLLPAVGAKVKRRPKRFKEIIKSHTAQTLNKRLDSFNEVLPLRRKTIVINECQSEMHVSEIKSFLYNENNLQLNDFIYLSLEDIKDHEKLAHPVSFYRAPGQVLRRILHAERTNVAWNQSIRSAAMQHIMCILQPDRWHTSISDNGLLHIYDRQLATTTSNGYLFVVSIESPYCAMHIADFDQLLDNIGSMSKAHPSGRGATTTSTAAVPPNGDGRPCAVQQARIIETKIGKVHKEQNFDCCIWTIFQINGRLFSTNSKGKHCYQIYGNIAYNYPGIQISIPFILNQRAMAEHLQDAFRKKKMTVKRRPPGVTASAQGGSSRKRQKNGETDQDYRAQGGKRQRIVATDCTRQQYERKSKQTVASYEEQPSTSTASKAYNNNNTNTTTGIVGKNGFHYHTRTRLKREDYFYRCMSEATLPIGERFNNIHDAFEPVSLFSTSKNL